MFNHNLKNAATLWSGMSPRVALASLLALASTAALAQVKVAYIDRFEPVATDASLGFGVYGTIPNNWGGHQSRITRHIDSIRVVYIKTDANGNMIWQLMRRGTGGWAPEASGMTTDDVQLLRDQRSSDRAYVVAWPNSVPTVFTSPSYAPVAFPGTWRVLPAKFRQYTNSGIAADGTLCLKSNNELATLIQTSYVEMDYECGKTDNANLTTVMWTWGGQQKHIYGLRHNYDYIFPNPPLRTPGMHGVAQKDLYKTASDVPNLDTSKFPYVYNGAHAYSTSISSDTYVDKVAVKPVPVPDGATVAPIAKLMDSFIDSKGRMFSSYHREDPNNSSVFGTYLVVQDAAGNIIYDQKWSSALETYANVRMFEDSLNRVWLIWSNRGSKYSQIRLYPVTESGSGSTLAFTLGAFTDVGGGLSAPYALDGNIYLANVRAGTSKSLTVDFVFNACTETYDPNLAYNNSNCYHSDRSGLMRVFYGRIRLPGS